MTADIQGEHFIQNYEQCKLKPYICPSGKPTIGWGNTFYPNGKLVTMQDKPITQAEADDIFIKVLAKFEKEVTSLLGNVKLPQHRFNALLSFAYNCGVENLKKSTLLKKVLVNQDDLTIWGEFLKWDKSNGVPSLGLKRRRKAEAHLYFKNEVNYYETLK
jgi:lysozyme